MRTITLSSAERRLGAGDHAIRPANRTKRIILRRRLDRPHLLPNPKTAILTLVPVSENTFRIDGKGYGELGDNAVFEIGPDGRAVSVMIGENRSEPVTFEPVN